MDQLPDRPPGDDINPILPTPVAGVACASLLVLLTLSLPLTLTLTLAQALTLTLTRRWRARCARGSCRS